VDSITGDGGNDTIYANDGFADSVDGGAGTDSGRKDTTEALWSSIEVLI
jgi:hypothetical protein